MRALLTVCITAMPLLFRYPVEGFPSLLTLPLCITSPYLHPFFASIVILSTYYCSFQTPPT